MAVNLSQISNFQYLANSLNVILVTPVQNNKYTPMVPTSLISNDSFLFDYEGENSTLMETDITDYYIETNSAIQDQVAIKPQIVTVQGYISELNNVVPESLSLIKTLVDKLTALSAYTPQLSISALRSYNLAVQAFNVAKNLKTTAQSVFGSPNPQGRTPEERAGQPLNNQQNAYLKFKGWFENRTLFYVQTPWATIPNMIIKSLKVTQDPETRMISTFEITFKEIKFADTKTVSENTSTVQGRGESQRQPQVQLGSSTPNIAADLDSVLSNYPGVLAS